MRKQFLLLLSFGTGYTSFSQTDSVAISSNESQITQAGEPIYNGREHLQYHPSIEGNPYYLSEDWQKGSVVFREVLYQDVFLKYDLVADEVIVRHVNGFSGVTLFTPRIQSFTLYNRRFAYLSPEQASLQPGIYEELVNGKAFVYAKRSKFIREIVASTGIEKKIEDKNSYYLLLNGSFHAIKKEKDVMKLLPEKKDEINRFLKDNGIKYKQNPEEALKKIVEYYNQISR